MYYHGTYSMLILIQKYVDPFWANEHLLDKIYIRVRYRIV